VSQPRAVVIPFGVPTEGRGLGLGLAALVHSFAQIEGHSVALAQLHARRAEDDPKRDEPTGKPALPLESYVSPSTWRDLSGIGHAPGGVSVVVTGALEPPGAGRGQIQILAFDAKSGTVRAKGEGLLDVQTAGESLVSAFEQLWSTVGGDLGSLRDIRDLDWDALESVLLAERCAMHDPARGGAHDYLAAMLHLGRAIGDAPEARFPAERLATIALEAGMGGAADPRLTHAALRALARASEDAPAHADLVEAAAALEIRLGNPREAEARMGTVIAQAPTRSRPYAILSQARRARGDLEGALGALDSGLSVQPGDPLLTNERGVVMAARGELDGAVADWQRVLAREPLNPAAFVSLATVAVQRRDAVLAQSLVDHALAGATWARPDVLRRALQLALASETQGLARGARLRELARALVEKVPDDAGGLLILGRALAELGEKSAAAERLAEVVRLAPRSAFAAEALRSRFALEDPGPALEVDSALRGARQAQGAHLDEVAARAERLATVHNAWPASLAAGIAHRRRGRLDSARHALEAALAVAPGSAEVHLELAQVLQEAGDRAEAFRHAERARALDPSSGDCAALVERLRDVTAGSRPSLLERIQGAWARWRKR
jgi:tetratricopeptide (TPR) repeat protein